LTETGWLLEAFSCGESIGAHGGGSLFFHMIYIVLEGRRVISACLFSQLTEIKGEVGRRSYLWESFPTPPCKVHSFSSLYSSRSSVLPTSSYAENLCPAGDAIKDARVVNGDILIRDDLDHFLRYHASCHR
jgi:hypothetical protein